MSSEQTKPIKPENIFHIYGELFPNEFEFLVLYHLYINYPASEMQYAEIKQAIVDTSHLPFFTTGRDRQIERTFKGLLRSFIERVPSKFNRFILTPHAERIVEIATQRINNPYLKFPLRDTFETYFALPADLSDDITKLQSWFKFGFQNNARQVVSGHLEGLKLSVDDAVKALNLVLEADNLSAIQMLEQFSKHFQVLGDKARQITEAIKMKVDVHYRLRDIVETYSKNASDRERIVEDNEVSQNHRRIAAQIKEEVSAFFDKVDKQLDLINMKMAFASSKITELQESLRTQSRYKISLKKMLVYLLENSHPDPQQWIKLPENFPLRGLVSQKFRFRGIRYYDVGFLKRTTPFEQRTDADYEASQRVLFEHELLKQASVQRHFEQVQADLSISGEISLDKRLFEIIRQENSVEIGIQTGYEVIRNISPDSHIDIQEELQSYDNIVHLWRITIQRR